MIDKFFAFVQKYPKFVHIFLILWNAFFTSWATKIAVPLQDLGIPITVNATAIVDWLQLHMHLPTPALGVLTFIINCIVAYTTWKKQHPDVPETPAQFTPQAKPDIKFNIPGVEFTLEEPAKSVEPAKPVVKTKATKKS